MKTHTFTFSGKGLAAVSAACTTGGLLMFSLGFAVGTVANGPVAERLRESHEGSTRTSHATSVSTTDPATWPFGSSEHVPTEAPSKATTDSATEALPVDPTKPAPASRERATMRTGLTAVSFIAPADAPGADDGVWIVQVGAFRNETNATLLAARLVASGYHPTVTTRDDNGRALHVVRVARIAGRARAEHVAESIGDAEHLVASIVADRN